MSALNYNHLRYFWTVAHDGNLTRAAGKLNLSQSALSAQIRKLEQQLGHALFERRGRALQLTEAGRIALDHADAVFAAGADLVGTLRQQGRVRTAFRVGALATLSRNFQLSFIRPLLGRADVEVILRSGGTNELMSALEAHQLDVVLTNQTPRRDALTPVVSHRLAEQAVSLVGLPAMAQAGAGDLPALLAGHPIVLPSAPGGMRTDFDALANRLGISPQIAAEVDDMAMMRLLVREGAGLGVLPPIVVQDELAAGTLVELASLPQIREQFFAITIARRFPNPLLAGLLDPGGV
jgi:LysR family transcriptional regulator, transcriptional activator of nhaA